MTRYVGNYIWVPVQIIDSNGNPVTGATINYKVYYENLEDSGTMTHMADGIYGEGFTPNYSGVWCFEAYNESLGFRKTFTFYVEEVPAEKNFVQQIVDSNQVSNPTQNEWIRLLALGDGLKIYSLSFYQQNNESAAKNVEVRIYIDGQYSLIPSNINGSRTSSSVRNVYLSSEIAQFYDNSVSDFPYVTFAGPTTFNVADKIVLSKPLLCNSFALDMRITSVNGTNQILAAQVSCAKKTSYYPPM